MQWIEQLLHISPDNGSGWMEFLIAIVVSLLVVPPGVRWIQRRRSARNHRR